MSEKTPVLRKAFLDNPVLTACVGIFIVIAGSSGLREALTISAVMTADLIICSVIASAMLKNVPRFIRVVIYLMLGMAIVCAVLWFLENKTLIDMSLGMRIYLPLIAVNSVKAVRCETFSVKNSVRAAFTDALATGLGVSAVMVICGVIREIIGKGALGGYSLGFVPAVGGMAMPFGCLIILGFLAAVLNAVNRRGKKKQEAKETDAQPEEVSFDFGGAETEDKKPQTESKAEEPAAVNIDLPGAEEDDEYAELLASVNELISSFSENKGGDGE